MRLPTWGMMLITVSCQSLLCSEEIIHYELREESGLTHSWADVEGRPCTLGSWVEVNLRGTFILDIIEQSKEVVEGKVLDIQLEEVEGANYTIVGSGAYLEQQMNYSHTAQPPNWSNWFFDLMINDIPIRFEPEPFAIANEVFPIIRQNMQTEPIRSNDCFSLGIWATPTSEDAKKFFRRGDVDGNGVRNLTDAIQVITHLFGGGIQISCSDAADANDDAKVDVSDAISILNYLFRAAELPAIPSTFCGLDPTSDELDCQGQRACMPES